ncbi:MAG: SEC-C metal-binding domain-containing protein, partial [Gammaproteobacteria bacterium]
LAAMDYLRQGIHLRGYAQKNPKQEFKREAFELFAQMLERIKREVIRLIYTVEVRAEEDVLAVEQRRRANETMQFMHAPALAMSEEAAAAGAMVAEEHPSAPFVRDERKIGRNEMCPCGSGKKYKHCHGKLA